MADRLDPTLAIIDRLENERINIIRISSSNHDHTIKLVEARADILRAIRKLKEIVNG